MGLIGNGDAKASGGEPGGESLLLLAVGQQSV